MSSTLTFTSQVRYVHQSGVALRVLGSASEPISITLSSDKFIDNSFSVATATTQVLLNVGTGSTDDISGFTVLRLVSTQAVSIEFQAGSAAANSNIDLIANVPFVLTSDNSRAYNASGGFAGAATDISKVTASNASGSTAVIQVSAFL